MARLMKESDIEALALKIEEAARSTEEGVRYFIEPAPGTLKRAIAKRHHIIFGRRGSGKSSLLRKAAADLTLDRRPIAYVDLEIFKGHSYPDVLISILIATLKEFEKWLRTAAINPANKTSFWHRLFGTKPVRGAYKRSDVESLSQEVHKRIEELHTQLYSPDAVATKSVDKTNRESSDNSGMSGELKTSSASLVAKTEETNKIQDTREVQKEYQHSKIEFLHQHILEYQGLFRRVQEVC